MIDIVSKFELNMLKDIHKIVVYIYLYNMVYVTEIYILHTPQKAGPNEWCVLI